MARIDEIDAVTKHDVIAFLTHLAEHVGSEEARFVHQGMTSSDVLDTWGGFVRVTGIISVAAVIYVACHVGLLYLHARLFS